MSPVRLKRVYEPKASDDGVRILVDRLWPRGLSREAAALDGWMKELAPSAALRRWFGHRAERWDEFVQRYREELSSSDALSSLNELSGFARKGALTLLYSASDEQRNQAIVLAEVLRQRAKGKG